MRVFRLAPVVLMTLVASSCASTSPIVTKPASVPESAYQIQKTFVLPHVLEKSGTIAGNFRIEIDGVMVAMRVASPTGDLDGDGMAEKLEAKVNGFVVNSHTGAFDLVPKDEPYSLTLTHRKGRPGRPVFGNITFEKITFDSAMLDAWLKETASGKNIRKSISIIMLDRGGKEEGRINFWDGSIKGARDAGSGMASGKRERGSGMATGRREAGSGMASGKREAGSGMATGRRTVGAGQVTEIVTFSAAKANYQGITVNEEGVR